MCEFHDSNGNGFGDIWWTDKLFYFSLSIDGKVKGEGRDFLWEGFIEIQLQ